MQINARLKRPEDFRDIVVARKNGLPVKLWQVADVVDGPQEVESLALYNGQRTLLMSVQKSQDENTIQVVDGLIKTVFDAETGELLGAHMIGAEVTELIQGYTIGKTLETTEAELMVPPQVPQAIPTVTPQVAEPIAVPPLAPQVNEYIPAPTVQVTTPVAGPEGVPVQVGGVH